jgi:hypothetical protein
MHDLAVTADDVLEVQLPVPVFFALMKERALRRGTLQPKEPQAEG